MSDLISRSKLKKTLLEYNYTTEHNQVFRYIDEQPTAYDIEKVISELKEKAENHGGEDYYVEIGDAVEIVNQVGVSDDVCEWRLCDEEENVYDTSCRNPHILIEGTPKENNYEYCPYCGKKIKIVGD